MLLVKWAVLCVIGLSFSTSIGRGCDAIAYSMLIGPHHLVNGISKLGALHNQSENEKEIYWVNQLQCSVAEKALSVMKEMHVILPIYSKDITPGNQV